jgi:hypothetical protein
MGAEVRVTIREGRWRCPRCNRENLGRDLACQGCGDPRGDDVKFYLPEEAPEVADEQLVARARSGADRLCEFCGASNPADAKVCSGCGAPLTERQRQEVVLPVQPPSPALPLASAQPPSGPAPPPPVAAKPDSEPSRGAKIGCLGCLGALLLAGVAFLAGSLWQRDAAVAVTGVSWRRSFDTERQVTSTRTAWKDQLPSGARVLSSRQAQRSTRQVQVGTTAGTETERYQAKVGSEKVKVGTRDLGNGFFEDVYEERPVYETRTRERNVTKPVYRDEPVYATEVTYQVDEWQLVRTARAEGADLEPRWPGLEAGERERAGSRKEEYRAFFSGPGGKRFSTTVTGAAFSRYPVGSRHRARVDLFGKLHGLR